MEPGRTPTRAGAKAGLRHYLAAVLLALVGGLFGIPAAFLAEVQILVSIPLLLLAPPIAEEILKPVGLYVFLFRWPSALKGQFTIAALAALSGVIFGLIESTVYVTVYAPDLSRAFFVYRFTVNVILHAAFSFTAGLGINRSLIDWATARQPFPKSSLGAFITAMALHLAYNLVAITLEATGVLDFD